MLRPLWLALGLTPGLAAAQAIVVDPSTSTRVSTSANNTPVVEIAAPNAAGISHNRYIRLDVPAPGVIFHNNAQPGVTATGGYVQGNPQLTQGNEARAIVNEVTGNNPTQVSGTLEVFGREADLFVVNKNGVTLNHTTFLNVRGFTASTGTPVVGPNGLQLQVDGGNVRIDANGVDTTGLSWFDIVAGTAELHGALGSEDQRTDLAVVTGRNTYDTATRTYQATATPGARAGAADPIAISGTPAGAMYGNNIRFISTESGAGVRHAGAVHAATDIVIDAKGPVQVATLEAGRDVDVRSTADIDVRDGNGINATGAVRLASEGGSVRVAGTSVEGDTLALQAAHQVLVQAAHLGAKNTTLAGPVKAIRIQAGEFVIEGELVAKNLDGSPLPADQPLEVYAGKLQVRRDAFRWDTDFRLESTATIVSDAGIEIVADRFVNDEGIVRDTGRNGSTIQAREIQQSGLFTTDGSLSLVADVFASACADGASVDGGFQRLCAGFVAGGDLEAHLRAMTSDAALLADGVLQLTLGDGHHSVGAGGGIGGRQSLTIAQADGARAQLTTAGELATLGNLTVRLDAMTQEADGVMSTETGRLDVQVDGSFDNAGALASDADISVTAADIISRGSASARTLSGNVAMTASNRLENEAGSQLMAGAVVLRAGTAIENAGTVFGDREVRVLSDGTLTNTTASVISSEVLHLSGDRIVNQAGAALEAGNTLRLDSRGDVVNDGGSAIRSDGLLEITAGGDVVNDGPESRITAVKAVIAAAGDVLNRDKAELLADTIQIDARGDVVNDDAGLLATETLDIQANDVVNRNRGLISATESVRIDAAGDVENRAAIFSEQQVDIVAAGNVTNDVGQIGAAPSLEDDEVAVEVTIAAGGNVTNRGKDSVIRGRNVTVEARNGDVLNDAEAVIRAIERAQVSASRDLVNRDAGISGTRVKLTADLVDNREDALVQADEDVDIDATRVANTDGAEILGTDIDIVATDEFVSDTGALVRGDTVSIDTSTLTARDGRILAEDHLDLRAHALDNTATMHSKHTTTVTMKDGSSLVIDPNHRAPTADTLLTVFTHDLTIARDGQMKNPGSIAIHATGDVLNRNMLMTGRSLSIDAQGGIENDTNALIWAADDATLQARYGIVNRREGVIATLDGDLDLVAAAVENDVGRITAGRDLLIDAATVTNQGRATGGIVAGGTEVHAENKSWSHNFRSTQFWLDFELPLFTSDIAIESALMSAGGDIRINQRGGHGAGAQVNNNDSQMLAGGDVLIDGHLHNRSTSVQQSLLDYMRDPATAVHLSARTSVAPANTYRRSFPNFYEFMNFVLSGSDDRHRIMGDYYFTNGNLIAGMREFLGDQYLILMSASVGADYKDKPLEVLAERWAATKAREAAGTLQGTTYYGDRRAEIVSGGNFAHTGGTFHNGGLQRQRQTVSVTVGSETVETIEADFESVLGSRFSLRGDYEMADLVAWLNPRELLDRVLRNPMFEMRDGGMPPLVLDGVGTVLVGATLGLGNNAAVAGPPRIVPLIENKNEFIDEDRYFNTAEFMRRLGYAPHLTVPVLADRYAAHVLLMAQIQESLFGHYEKLGLNEFEVSERLQENGIAAAAAAGWTHGEPLTKEQYENLETDIVWLEKTVVNGHEVLQLQFYPSKATLEGRAAQSGTAAMVSAGGNVSIDAQNVHNIDGTIEAGGSVRIRSEGDIVNQALGGADGGIRSNGDGGVVSLEADGDIENTGALIEGNQVRLAAGGDITLSTTTRIDEDGHLVSRRDGGVFGTGEDNAVHFEAGGDIRMTGVEVDADTLRLKAAGNVDVEDVMEVSSFFDHESDGDVLRQTDITRQGSSATSTGSSLTARDRLILDVGGDFTITGGSIDAIQTSGTVGGDFTAVAGQNLEHYREDTYSVGLEVGGRASAFGHESAGTDYGTRREEYEGRVGDGMNTGEAGGGRPDAMHNTGGLQARWGYGIERTSYEREEVDYTNVQLNLGSGSLDVGGTFDFGGADLNAADYQRDANLAVSAERIQTTTYESRVTETSTSDATFFGHSMNGTSSLANISNEWGKKGADYVDGKKEDGLVAAMVAGQGLQVGFDEIGSISGGPTVTNTKTSSSRKETSENINTIGGSFSFTSRTDIDLVGVQTSNPNATIVLDAAGDVNLRAARSTVEETTERVDTMVTAGFAAGYTPSMGGGVGFYASYEGGTENTSLQETTWQNTVLGGSGANVTIRSGNNTTLDGAVVEGRVDMNVGGNLSVQSKQDEKSYKRVRASWGGSGGVAVAEGGLMPTGSGHVEGGEDWDNSRIVNQQSGIRGTADSSITVQGDVGLKGGYITGGGALAVGGDIHAETLVDTREKDGGYFGGGGGLSKIGKPTGSVATGRVDHSHYEAENRATIDMEVSGLPGSDRSPVVHGDLNTNPDEMHVVNRDEHYAGTDMRFSIGQVGGGKKKPAAPGTTRPPARSNRVAPAPAPDAPSTPRPSTPSADGPNPSRPSTPDADAPQTRPPSAEPDAPSTRPPTAGDDGNSSSNSPPKTGDEPDAPTQAPPKAKKSPSKVDVRYINAVQIKALKDVASDLSSASNARQASLYGKSRDITLQTPMGDLDFSFVNARQLLELNGLPTYDGDHKKVYVVVTQIGSNPVKVKVETRTNQPLNADPRWKGL